MPQSPHDPVIASIVLVDGAGNVLGRLPELPTTMPWWQEVGQIADRVREEYDLSVTILRLLESERRRPPGGVVTYLAELGEDPAPLPRLLPYDTPLGEHPLRLPYALPGGPARDLEWARAQLLASGHGDVQMARQVRTWNLSSIWCISTERARFWLKVVPPFFGHEGAALTLFQGEAVPELVASDGSRVLMPDIPGEDCYEPSGTQVEQMVEMLVDMQWRWHDRVAELRACGLPHWGLAEYTTRARDLLERQGERLADADADTLSRFLDALPDRWHAIDACGIPEMLVHGDFHPGNVRATGERLTILDWGDCYIGHPLLDRPPMLERIPPATVERIDRLWLDCWRARLPDADVATAARLLEPVAAMRLALVFQLFLDNIEPSERVYHRDDPEVWLLRSAALLRAER